MKAERQVVPPGVRDVGLNLRSNHERYKVLYPDDNRIGTMSVRPEITLLLSADEPIAGLDERLEV